MEKEIKIFTGGRYGEIITLLGGVHGDEIIGVQIIKELMNALTDSYVNFAHQCEGTIQIGFGNPEAIKKGTRSASNGRDLNRSFVPEELDLEPTDNDRVDLQRARDLALYLDDTDYLIDIHSTSSPSESFVCMSHLVSVEHKNFCKLFPVKNVLLDPYNVLVKHYDISAIGTTDYFVNTFGKGFAICYETGYAQDMTKKEDVMLLVLQLLLQKKFISFQYYEFLCVYLNLYRGELDALPENQEQKYFYLTDDIVAEFHEFTYESGKDCNWQYYEQGVLIGQYKNGVQVAMPHNGYVIFPKSEEKIRKGHSLFYLAQELDS